MSLSQAVIRVGQRVGVNSDTFRGRVKQADIDAGERPGAMPKEAQRIGAWEAEDKVKDLKRGSQILLAASSFFARQRRRYARVVRRLASPKP